MLSQYLKNFIKTTPTSTGVYHFLAANHQILYIGKAKNLQNRLKSYSNDSNLSPRINKMTSLATKIDLIICENEQKALLLECNLIKQKQPKFNILLKDDKSFPFILVNTEGNFAKIEKHRGVKNKKGHYFGPFANSHYLNIAVELIRKSFLLRDCKDSEFKRRKTPCLEYQIKRCSAPCVKNISTEDYQHNVKNSLAFLNGKNTQIQQELAAMMHEYRENMEYEKALILRDKIKTLSAIQTKFTIKNKWAQDSDIIFVEKIADSWAISFSFYRFGYDYGSKFYFFEESAEVNLDEIILQFYLSCQPPTNIFFNGTSDNKNLLQKALEDKYQKQIKIELFDVKNYHKSTLNQTIIKQKQQQIFTQLEHNTNYLK